MKRMLFLLQTIVTIFLCSCDNSNEEQWKNPLNEAEIATLRSSVDKIDTDQIIIYRQKIKNLSMETLPISSPDVLRNLESYKNVYGWIKSNVNNFPLLFQYIIYDEKIIDEEKSNTLFLLWDLSDEIYPSITEEMRETNNYSSVYLIKTLLVKYF